MITLNRARLLVMFLLLSVPALVGAQDKALSIQVMLPVMARRLVAQSWW